MPHRGHSRPASLPRRLRIPLELPLDPLAGFGPRNARVGVVLEVVEKTVELGALFVRERQLGFKLLGSKAVRKACDGTRWRITSTSCRTKRLTPSRDTARRSAAPYRCSTPDGRMGRSPGTDGNVYVYGNGNDFTAPAARRRGRVARRIRRTRATRTPSTFPSSSREAMFVRHADATGHLHQWRVPDAGSARQYPAVASRANV
jgi:hypothetical protein